MGTFRKLKNIAKDTLDYVDKVSKTVNETDYLRKGQEFEKYVIKLFNEHYFCIVNWTHDQDHKHAGVRVETDKEPDIKVRYKPTGEEFFVECKFRGNLSPDNKLEWTNEYSLKKYQRFNSLAPVFIAIGLGGEPSSPNRMFCIPLKEAKWTGLYSTVYSRFERPTLKMFFWKDGELR